MWAWVEECEREKIIKKKKKVENTPDPGRMKSLKRVLQVGEDWVKQI